MSRQSVAIGALLLSTTATAAAHTFKRSFADVKPTPDGASVIFDLDPGDLDDTLRSRFDRDRSGFIDIGELQGGKPLLGNIVRAGMVVERGGERCDAELVDSSISMVAKMLRARLHYTCAVAGLFTIRVPLLTRTRRGHVHLMTVRLADGVVSIALNGAHLTWEQPPAPTALGIAWDFLLVGISHILRGYDHLLFLLALLLVARSLGEIIKVVTAFTVAHSITLVAAGLGAVTMPERVVESAIALSIAAVGAQNLWAADSDRQLRSRWLVTFVLGLVHGFGFAGVLAEMKLPEAYRVWPLFSFNVGVEIGQLAVVLAVVPALRALRQQVVPWRARALIAAGGLVGGGALYPLEPLCAVGTWAAALLSVGLVPLFGFRRTVVTGGSIVVAVLGTIWFVGRAFF